VSLPQYTPGSGQADRDCRPR